MKKQRVKTQMLASGNWNNVGWIQHCNGYNLTQKYLTSDQRIMAIMEEASAALGFKNPLKRLAGEPKT